MTNPYLAERVLTASPQRLVVMLYDRLLLDLERADHALDAGSHSDAHAALVHAQDIVTELHSALDTSAWPEGVGLAALYDYVMRRLIDANLGKDRTIVAECHTLLEPLRDAWREIAGLGANAA